MIDDHCPKCTKLHEECLCKHTSVKVYGVPKCDLDPDHGPAWADVKTTRGPWGYLCRPCAQEFGVGLGLGFGQRLLPMENVGIR